MTLTFLRNRFKRLGFVTTHKRLGKAINRVGFFHNLVRDWRKVNDLHFAVINDLNAEFKVAHEADRTADMILINGRIEERLILIHRNRLNIERWIRCSNRAIARLDKIVEES
jgi:hypothetical protein